MPLADWLILLAAEDESGRLDGDLIAVGERVRVHLTNYDRVEISFGICSASACSVIGINGVSKDKRLDYRTWVTTDGEVRQRDNPILDSVRRPVRETRGCVVAGVYRTTWKLTN